MTAQSSKTSYRPQTLTALSQKVAEANVTHPNYLLILDAYHSMTASP